MNKDLQYSYSHFHRQPCITWGIRKETFVHNLLSEIYEMLKTSKSCFIFRFGFKVFYNVMITAANKINHLFTCE